MQRRHNRKPEHMQDSPYRPPRPRDFAGILAGCATLVVWSLYNVGSKIGQEDGFASIDLVFLRFAIGGALMLPVLWFTRRQRGPRFPQLVALTLLSGPLFAYFIAQGFHLAPLSHGIVIAPCVSMTVTMLLLWRLDGQAPTPARLVGMGIMAVGLVLVGIDASRTGAQSTQVPLLTVLQGDIAFALGAAMWGGYTYLMGRWKLEPLALVSRIMVCSALITLPAYAVLCLREGMPEHATALWAEQIFYQGLCGGSLAFICFALTVSQLGAARASLFFAMVPPAALVAAVPLMGLVPSLLQCVAIALATGGILVSLRARRR